MTLETLTTITLLTELLLALRASDPKGFRTLLEMGLDELGLDVLDELTGPSGATAERGGSRSNGGLELGSEP